jgi:hypothetical protein
MAILGLAFVGMLPAPPTPRPPGKRIAASFGWGALVGLVGPIAAALVLVTIVGIPLGLTCSRRSTCSRPSGVTAGYIPVATG